MLAKNTNSAKTFKKVAGKNKWHYSCFIVILYQTVFFLEDTHVRLATIWSPQNMPCAVVEPSVIGREWIQSADVST